MGGSSKKQTIGYKYKLGIHMILCHSKLDNLYRIMVDGRTAWSEGTEGGQIEIAAEELFGGESREGGVSGLIDVEMGAPDQLQNSYLQTHLGTDIPAFRGVSGVVLRQCYVGMNPYLKPWSFRAKRIHTRSDGQQQWYDEKSEIATRFLPGEVISGINSIPGYFMNIEYMPDTPDRPELGDDAKWQAFDPPYDVNGHHWASPAYTLTDWDSPYPEATNHKTHAVWEAGKFPIGELSQDGTDGGASAAGYDTDFQYASPRQSATFARLPVYFPDEPGSDWTSGVTEFDIWVDNAISISVNGNPVFSEEYYYGGEKQGSYTNEYFRKGLNIIAIRLGDDTGGGVNDLAMLTFKNYEDFLPGGTYLDKKEGDMNPAHIIRECLTDGTWGMGYLESDIDDDSFRYAADTLYSEGMGMSLLWDKQMPIEDFVKEVIRHINAVLYVDRTTGKFVLKLVRDDYDSSALLVLNESNIAQISDYSRVAQGDIVNSVTVVYWDAETGNNASVSVDNPALILSVGSVIGTTIQYPGFTTSSLATRAAERDLKTLSSTPLTVTLEANREASFLNIGEVFKLEWPDYHDGSVVMRVMQMALGDGKTNRVKITATEDVFSLPFSSTVSDESGSWEDTNKAPVPAPHQLAIETPYYELVQAFGQSAVDDKLLTYPELGHVLAAASRPPGGLNARLWTNSGAGYEEVAGLDFSPVGVLSVGVGWADTVLQLSDYQGLDAVSVGSHAQVGNELVRVDSVDPISGVVTVSRGVLDTIPVLHSAGDAVFFWDEFAVWDDTELVAGEEVSVKIVTTSTGGVLDIADAPESAVTMQARAGCPYPPGNIKVSDEYLPAQVLGSAEVTFETKNRLQQTAPENLIGWFEPGIPVEPGVKTVVEVYDADTDVLLHTVPDATSPLDLSGETTLPGNCKISLFSLNPNSGLMSMAHSLTFLYGAQIDISLPPTPICANGGAFEWGAVAGGGQGALTWGVLSGALPKGLLLGSDGVISGVPDDAVGEYLFTLWVRDAAGTTSSLPASITLLTCSLMMHFEGSDNGTVFVDDTGKPISLSGSGLVTKTDEYKVGGASARFPGNGAQLTTPNHADFDLSSDDWTISFWLYQRSYTGNSRYGTVISKRNSGGDHDWSVINLTNGSVGLQRYNGSSGNAFAMIHDTAVQGSLLNTWAHLAISRRGGLLRCFSNGQQTFEYSQPVNLRNRNLTVQMGRSKSYSDSRLNANVDELSIFKGGAVYWDDDFTPPEAPVYQPQSLAALSVKGSLPEGTAGTAYSSLSDIEIFGVGPFTVSAAGLPAGWSASVSGGYVEVLGPATAAGDYPVTLSVSDGSVTTDTRLVIRLI